MQCSILPGPAREKVRVARALGKLPRIDDELRRGRLSFSKARAMTRVATQENEVTLIELARGMTGAQLEKTCRLIDQTRPRDPMLDEERRWLRTRELPNGMVKIEAQLRPEEAARVVAACDVFATSASERADALVTIAEATLRGDKPERPPVEIMVHIDAATLTGAQGAYGVSAETCRRLLCDAGVVPILDDEHGNPVQVGRKSRVFAGALRRALLARADGSCQFPGCTNTRYLHGHHVRHWIDGGETTLANGLILCTRHHTLVHEGAFRIIATQQGLTFVSPDGRSLMPQAPPAPTALTFVDELPPVWDGEPVDYEEVIGCVSS
ncbi:MAG TPA: DUF222 domain-containing protein [Gemmatimonadaceae bacterium]